MVKSILGEKINNTKHLNNLIEKTLLLAHENLNKNFQLSINKISIKRSLERSSQINDIIQTGGPLALFSMCLPSIYLSHFYKLQKQGLFFLLAVLNRLQSRIIVREEFTYAISCLFNLYGKTGTESEKILSSIFSNFLGKKPPFTPPPENCLSQPIQTEPVDEFINRDKLSPPSTPPPTLKRYNDHPIETLNKKKH